MPQFVIEIEETLIRTFKIESDSEEQAERLVEAKYKDAHEDFVLSADDFFDVKFRNITSEIDIKDFELYVESETA